VPVISSHHNATRRVRVSSRPPTTFEASLIITIFDTNFTHSKQELLNNGYSIDLYLKHIRGLYYFTLEKKLKYCKFIKYPTIFASQNLKMYFFKISYFCIFRQHAKTQHTY
jgi:hypothetical protein